MNGVFVTMIIKFEKIRLEEDNRGNWAFKGVSLPKSTSENTLAAIGKINNSGDARFNGRVALYLSRASIEITAYMLEPLRMGHNFLFRGFNPSAGLLSNRCWHVWDFDFTPELIVDGRAYMTVIEKRNSFRASL